MAHNVVFAGVTYSIPDTDDTGWQDLTDFLDALAEKAATTTSQSWQTQIVNTTPYSILPTDTYVGVNVGSASIVNLPPGVDGRILVIKDESGNAVANNVVVTPAGGDTINGLTTFNINKALQAIFIVYRNGDWKIIANGIPSPAIISSLLDTASIHLSLNANGILTADVIAQSLTDAYINPSANIARTKLASGSNNHVLINSGTGVMSSESQLLGSRGGTGIANAGTLNYGANPVTLNTTGSTTLSLPTSGTLATLAGTETLTNKTLSGNTSTNFVNGSGTLHINSSGTIIVPSGATTTLVGRNTTDTLSNKSFDTNTDINGRSQIRFYNLTNTNYTALRAASSYSGNIILNLPSSMGTSGQLLSTNGSGDLLFISPSDPLATIQIATGNLILTNADSRKQICNPSSNVTYTLPTTDIPAGDVWMFTNRTSDKVITVNSSAGNFVATVFPKSVTVVTSLQATPTTAAHWLFTSAESYEPVVYTPTIGAGFGTVTNAKGFATRSGKYIKVIFSFVCGTTTANPGYISIPFNYTVDSSFLGAYGASGAFQSKMGSYSFNFNSSSGIYGSMVFTSAFSSWIYFGSWLGGTTRDKLTDVTSVTGQITGQNNIGFSGEFTAPISG